MLRREGWTINRKWVYRGYREEGLALRRQTPWQHVSGTHRLDALAIELARRRLEHRFLADDLANGTRCRTLTILDPYTRECLDVVAALDRLKASSGMPRRIHCDNGSEFCSAQMDVWAYVNGVRIDFGRRGKPTDNAFIESFNRKVREECLNAHWFGSLEDAEQKIDEWRWEYNEKRPHRSLNGLKPREFVGRMSHNSVADSP